MRCNMCILQRQTVACAFVVKQFAIDVRTQILGREKFPMRILGSVCMIVCVKLSSKYRYPSLLQHTNVAWPLVPSE